MKKILIALLAILLVGCAVQAPDVKPSIIIQDRYVASPIPDALLVIPPQVSPLDLSTATQKSVADWLVRSEARTQDLEEKLIEIGKIEQDQKTQQLEGK